MVMSTGSITNHRTTLPVRAILAVSTVVAFTAEVSMAAVSMAAVSMAAEEEGIADKLTRAIFEAGQSESRASTTAPASFPPPPIDRVLALSDGPLAYQQVDGGQVRWRIVLAS
jgi:hypothetical protein